MTAEIYELYKVSNSDLVAIIKEYQLDSTSRRQDHVYKRYYLYWYMRHHRRMTFSMIGNFFNRDHSTVLHGYNQHRLWNEYKDEVYLCTIHPLPVLLKAKHDNKNIFHVTNMPICDEESTVMITGNFSKNILNKFDGNLAVTDIIDIFGSLRVNTREGV